ncbi:hypothetical protein [Geoglobus acetivorans]
MRLLIEEFIPVEEISEEAIKGKSGRAPTFELHYLKGSGLICLTD